MLRHPDDVPNAPMLRWVSWIMLFDFETKHVPASAFKIEDALSRSPQIPSNYPNAADHAEEFLDAYEIVYGRAECISIDVTPTTFYRFCLQMLQIKYSNPFQKTTSFPGFSYHISNTMTLDEQDMLDNTHPQGYMAYTHAAPYSLLHTASLGNVQPWNSQYLPEFHRRKQILRVPIAYTHTGH